VNTAARSPAWRDAADATPRNTVQHHATKTSNAQNEPKPALRATWRNAAQRGATETSNAQNEPNGAWRRAHRSPR